MNEGKYKIQFVCWLTFQQSNFIFFVFRFDYFHLLHYFIDFGGFALRLEKNDRLGKCCQVD